MVVDFQWEPFPKKNGELIKHEKKKRGAPGLHWGGTSPVVLGAHKAGAQQQPHQLRIPAAGLPPPPAPSRGVIQAAKALRGPNSKFGNNEKQYPQKTKPQKKIRTIHPCSVVFPLTAESFGISAQIGSRVVRSGPEVGFHEGSTRVPQGFHNQFRKGYGKTSPPELFFPVGCEGLNKSQVWRNTTPQHGTLIPTRSIGPFRGEAITNPQEASAWGVFLFYPSLQG